MEPTRKRILCVEDDEDTCQLMIYLLELSDYEVRMAKTMTEGLRLAVDEDFDLYLLDNILPDGTGLELCLRIRSLDPRTPILFHSGSAYEEDRQQALEAGAQVYLRKPSDPEDLMRAISQLLTP